MTRRELLAAAGAAFAAPLWGRTRWDKARISAITDEIGNTVEEAIAFAHQYALTHVEIRDRHTVESRKEYFTLDEAVIKADAMRFKQEGLHVTFINTSLMKYHVAGDGAAAAASGNAGGASEAAGEPRRRSFDNRMEDLQKAIHCAQWMGCDKVRVFTGTRLADPRSAFAQIADTIGPMALAAEKEKVYLLIENEGSQNVGTSAELADIMKAIPSKWLGMNWDPHNAYGKETSYPDGYKLLPQKRLMNIQVKAKGRDAGQSGERGLEGHHDGAGP